MQHPESAIRHFRSREPGSPLWQSEAVKAGPFVFTSAKMATDWKHSIVEEARVNAGLPYFGTAAELQADYILRSLARTLQEAGSSFAKVVKAHVFLRESAAFPGFDRAWKRYFSAPPTRTTVGAAGLLVPDAVLEVALIALTNESGLERIPASSDGPKPLTKKVEAMRGGDFVFTSGQLAHDAVQGVPPQAQGKNGVADIQKQTSYTLDNLLRSLKAAGADPSQVVKCQALLLDGTDESEYRRAWHHKLGKQAALSVLGLGSLLVGGTVLEIDLTAYTGDRLRLSNLTADRGPEAVACGDLVFSAGIFPGFDTGELPAECAVHPAYPHYSSAIALQTRWVLKRLEAALQSVGSDLSRVAKAQVFLTDLADFAEFEEVWRAHFPTPPARSVVKTSGLPTPGARIAVEAIALA